MVYAATLLGPQRGTRADNGLGNDGHNPLASPRDAATDALVAELRAAIGEIQMALD
jgi:hypothetical protein